MEDLENVRQKILKGLLKLMAGAGLIAMGPSLWACYRSQYWALMVLDCLVYAWIVLMAFLPGVGHRVRLVSVIVIGLGLGAAVMVMAGANGAGYVWLTFAVLVAALLGRKGLTKATYVATLAITLLYAGASALGVLSNGQNPAAVLVIASNLAAVFAALIFVVRFLVHGLELNLEASRKAAQKLELELGRNEGLLRELNHRVRNNMQLSLSLVGIEAANGQGSREEGLAAVERRLRALAITNDLIIDHTDFERVELRDLARLLAFAESGLASKEAGGRRLWTLEDFSCPIGAGQAIVLGIAIAEIIHVLAGPEGGRISVEDRGQGPLLVFSPAAGPEPEARPRLEGIKALLPPDSLGLAGAEAGRGPEVSLALEVLPA